MGLNLYERYMNETTLIDGDLSFTGLSRFGLVNRDLLKDLQYRFENPELEPAHWSIFSECDVNRVAAMLDLQIVMFAYEPTASERISPSSADADYWFDKCPRLQRPEDSGCGTTREPRPNCEELRRS